MQQIGGYPIHPACALLPMMSDAAIAELAEDIRRHGQQQPIWTYGGALLDGRNRLLACLRAEVEPDVRAWEGDDPVRWVLSMNFHRRHLSDSQKAVVGARAVTMLTDLAAADAAAALPASAEVARSVEGADGEAAPGSSALPGADATTAADAAANTDAETAADAPPVVLSRPPRSSREARQQAAALVNVSERAIVRGRKLLDQAVPDLVSAVERGAVNMAAATTIATLAPAEQQLVVEQGDAAMAGEARRIRLARTTTRPTLKLALARLDEELPEVRIDKALDGRWRITGRSPDLDGALEVDEATLRDALLAAWSWLEAQPAGE